MKKISKIIGVALIAAVGSVMLIGCNDDNQGTKSSRQVQAEVIADAFEAVPAYQPSSFPAREAINWHLQQTESASLWYVYALNWDGEVVFYLTSKYRPQNVCVGITAPDYRDAGNAGVINRSAPSLTGVYRGSDSCSTFFVQDNLTGSLIEISGTTFTIVASTVPLSIETDGALELVGVE